MVGAALLLHGLPDTRPPCTALAEDILYFAGDLSQVEALGLRLGLELVTSENEASIEQWGEPSSLHACLPFACLHACLLPESLHHACQLRPRPKPCNLTHDCTSLGAWAPVWRRMTQRCYK